MDFGRNVLKSFCNRRRSRSPHKSEKFINIARKDLNDLALVRQRSAIFFARYAIPTAPEILLSEVIEDSSSIDNLRSVVEILSEIKAKNTVNLHNKTEALNGSEEFIQVDPVKKQSKLEIFLNVNKGSISVNEIKVVQKSLELHDDREFFSQVYEYKLTYKDAKRLRPGRWLNDKIMNSYIKLCPTDSTLYVFNTYFFQILETMEQSVWSLEKINRILNRAGLKTILSRKYLVIPVNINQNHWVVAAINHVSMTIEYYDSVDIHNMDYVCRIIEKLLELLGIEEYDWEAILVPLQSNGFDCGMFALKTILSLCNNVPFNFSSDDMKFYRKIMLAELKYSRLFVE